MFGVDVPKYTADEQEAIDRDDFRSTLIQMVDDQYAAKEKELSEAGVDSRQLERMILLRNVDVKWMDHIDAMDQFRRGIGLRALGQRDPIVEYRMEGFDMFEGMVDSIQEDTVYALYHVRVESRVPEQPQVQNVRTNAGADGAPQEKPVPRPAPVAAATGSRQASRSVAQQTSDKPAPYHAEKKVGRNEPCPCGSGKKYKNCCGKQQQV